MSSDGIRIARDTTLEAIAAAWTGYSDLCESPPESDLLGILVREAAGLQMSQPGPAIGIWPQCPVRDTPYRVDFLVMVGRQELAFEVDGFAYHSEPRAFARDRQRDRELAARRIPTHRFTAHEVSNQPERVRHDVARLLLQPYLSAPDDEPTA